MKPTLVYSDLDGTLLDHYDYSFAAAIPILDRLQALNIPVILNSSKTRAEIVSIKSQMHNQHPFIVENGAAVFIPANYFPDTGPSMQQQIMGPGYQQILNIIHALREQRDYPFKGFADFSDSELGSETGLNIDAAHQAKQRSGSEPIKWLGDETSLAAFTQAVEKQQLKLIRGGRFIHVMGRTDKAQAMLWLNKKYRQLYPEALQLIALGDSENDRNMLESADFAAVIRSVKGTCMQLTRKDPAVVYTNKPAPEGWQEAMNIILKRIV